MLKGLEKTSKYWLENSEKTLREHLRNSQNINKAKNIIYFIGDGMSLTTISASRIFKGQLNGKRGEESILSFEQFPHVGLSKVFFFAFSNKCEITHDLFICQLELNFVNLYSL